MATCDRQWSNIMNGTEWTSDQMFVARWCDLSYNAVAVGGRSGAQLARNSTLNPPIPEADLGRRLTRWRPLLRLMLTFEVFWGDFYEIEFVLLLEEQTLMLTAEQINKMHVRWKMDLVCTFFSPHCNSRIWIWALMSLTGNKALSHVHEIIL